MGKLFFLIITVALIIGSVVLSTFNTQLIDIDLYFNNYNLPLSLVLLYAFISGAFISLIYLIGIVLSYKKRARQLKISLENNQEELDNLRRNPLRDGTE
tara:strand:- start:18 stop:314 length:297 start_codon:yes stop_codon:yes gene_type:complete